MSNLIVLLPFFKALLCIVPIVGKEASLVKTLEYSKYLSIKNKIRIPKHKLIIKFMNSTMSCPIQGIALIRLVIQN